MKIKRFNRIEVVSEVSPQTFQDKLNETYQRLAGRKFEQSLYNNQNGFTAYITYEEIEQTPECLKDEYEIKGISFKCGDCPYFEPINNYEGMCDFCRGKLRKNDKADCGAFWQYMEEKEEGDMFEDIREEIKKQYGSMGKFAEASGIDITYLSRIFHGKIKLTDTKKLVILRTLGIAVSDENLEKYF